MAGKSNIEWTGHTWNPLAGCTVLTPGCKRCYAMKMAARLEAMGQPLYAGLTEPSNAGPVWTGIMRQAPEYVLLAPLRRKKPTTYFVNSMSDLFHKDAKHWWIDRVFAVMALTPWHTYQVLTKRAGEMREYITDPNTPTMIGECAKEIMIPEPPLRLMPWPLPNVWLGVSTERQQEADERIPLLLQTPAAIRFISAEPLLRPINLERIVQGASWGSVLEPAEIHGGTGQCVGLTPALDWVIVGGESGPGYRPMAAEWARCLRDQCVSAGVPVFVKQMAGKKPIPNDLMVRQFPT